MMHNDKEEITPQPNYAEVWMVLLTAVATIVSCALSIISIHHSGEQADRALKQARSVATQTAKDTAKQIEIARQQFKLDLESFQDQVDQGSAKMTTHYRVTRGLEWLAEDKRGWGEAVIVLETKFWEDTKAKYDNDTSKGFLFICMLNTGEGLAEGLFTSPITWEPLDGQEAPVGVDQYRLDQPPGLPPKNLEPHRFFAVLVDVLDSASGDPFSQVHFKRVAFEYGWEDRRSKHLGIPNIRRVDTGDPSTFTPLGDPGWLGGDEGGSDNTGGRPIRPVASPPPLP